MEKKMKEKKRKGKENQRELDWPRKAKSIVKQTINFFIAWGTKMTQHPNGVSVKFNCACLFDIGHCKKYAHWLRVIEPTCHHRFIRIVLRRVTALRMRRINGGIGRCCFSIVPRRIIGSLFYLIRYSFICFSFTTTMSNHHQHQFFERYSLMHSSRWRTILGQKKV